MNAPSTETRELLCKLTPDEMTAKSQKLVETEQELAKKEAEKKAAVSGFNAGLKQTKADIQQLVKELSTGEEKREVQVEARYRYQEDLVEYVRLDTQEVIDSRPMDAFDRQEQMEYDGQDPDVQPKKRQRRKKEGLSPEAQGEV